MSEMDELKKSAEEQHRVSMYKEVNVYLDALMARLDIRLKRCKEAFYIFAGAWLVWFIIGFIHEVVLGLIGFTLYMVAWGYMVYRDRQLSRDAGELRGALKILKILGLSDKDWDDIGNKKKRPFWSEGVDLVKKWFTQKKEAQEAAYAPV